jgi:hypothetical protein
MTGQQMAFTALLKYAKRPTRPGARGGVCTRIIGGYSTTRRLLMLAVPVVRRTR